MILQILNRLGILGSQRGQGYILCAVTAVRRIVPCCKRSPPGCIPWWRTDKAVGRAIGRSLACCWKAGNRALLEEIAGRRLMESRVLGSYAMIDIGVRVLCFYTIHVVL